MKLLLEEPEISCRLQVLILADEMVLRHAIADKFRALIADKVSSGLAPSSPAEKKRKIAECVVREHLEKIFACHLRMGPLGRADVAELVNSFTAPYLEHAIASAPPGGTDAITRDAAAVQRKPVAAAETAEPPTRPGLHSATPPARPRAVPLIFTIGEIRVLRAYFSERVSEGDSQATSPRALRAFFFKYQLCRLLVQLTGRDDGDNRITPPQIFNELILRCFEEKATGQPHSTAPPDLKRLVGQVV